MEFMGQGIGLIGFRALASALEGVFGALGLELPGHIGQHADVLTRCPNVLGKPARHRSGLDHIACQLKLRLVLRISIGVSKRLDCSGKAV